MMEDGWIMGRKIPIDLGGSPFGDFLPEILVFKNLARGNVSTINKPNESES